MKNPLLITIATMLIWSACKRDEKKEPEVHYSYLSAEQRNKTPYFNNPAFDTLTFLSNKGDTLIFAKLKTDSFFIMTGGRPFPDHPGIYTYHQTLRNTYQTLKGNGKFEVRHSKLSSSGYPNNILISINNEIYHVNDNWLSKSFGYTYSMDSIKIEDKVFKNVIYVFSRLGDESTNRMYLNVENGAFYIQNVVTKDYWLLIRK